MRNPFRVWHEFAAEEARITERANQRIAWDRFAASHQDPEIRTPKIENPELEAFMTTRCLTPEEIERSANAYREWWLSALTLGLIPKPEPEPEAEL